MARDQVVRTRRSFLRGSLVVGGLGLLSGCGLIPPLPVKIHRITRLSAGSSPSTEAMTSAFRQGLRDLGYVEGQNLVVDVRNVDGIGDLAEATAEVSRLQTEVIALTAAGEAIRVHAVTTTIPIVSFGVSDLLTTGLVASLARPGGNVTGLSTPFLAGKQLQLLQATVPALSRVAVLFDPTAPTFAREPYQAVEPVLGIELQFVGATEPEDLKPAFDSMLREHADGLLLLTNPVISANQARIAELAMQRRLPSMWGPTDAPGRGGLMAYGANRADMARRAATFVDKILKGAKPADLPIEQPTVFDFVVNLKTAQALGLTIPPSVLQQATEIIP